MWPKLLNTPNLMQDSTLKYKTIKRDNKVNPKNKEILRIKATISKDKLM
jgi:hypothetical protein